MSNIKAVAAARPGPGPGAGRRPPGRPAAGGLAGVLALGAALLGQAAVAHAQDSRAQVFAGGQIDTARSGYVGGTLALPGSVLNRGFAVRGDVFGGDYDYRSNGRKIDGDFWGAELDALYQLNGPGWWFDAGAGVRYVDTHLSPFDQGNRRHGKQAEPALLVDGGRIAGPWRVDYYGSYGTRIEDYQLRGSLTHRLTDRLRAGGEVSAEGDPTYDLQRVGPYVGYAFNRTSELQATAGVSRQSGEGEGGYLRVAFVHNF